MRTPRMTRPNAAVLSVVQIHSVRSVRFGAADTSHIDFPAEQPVDQCDRRRLRYLRRAGEELDGDRPRMVGSKGQSATSPVRARETAKTSGSVPFGQVRLPAVTTDVTTTLRSSLRLWVAGSSSAGPGDTVRLARNTLLSD